MGKWITTPVALLLLACCVIAADNKPRIIDIYIYETYRLDRTITYYSWINDSYGGDFEAEGGPPEISVAWIQASAIYLTNKDGDKGKGLTGQPSIYVNVAGPNNNVHDRGVSGPLKLSFGKMEDDSWNGHIYILVPYKATYTIKRTVRIVKEER